MRLATIALLALSVAADAQEPCAPSRAERYLDENRVRALLTPDGSLFGSGEGYEVPRGGGVVSIYRAEFWLSGLARGEPRAAAGYYEGNEGFRPGPLDERGLTVGDCRDYDRVWVVSATDIATYERTGVAGPDLGGWPHDLGAPVLDGDGDPTNYDLIGGDRPGVSGDETAFWVMNDVGPPRYWRGSPLHMEVRVEAFAKVWNEPAVHNATLYRYRLIYRGDAPLDSAYVGLFLDTELGNGGDDYLGSDSALGLAYTYNGDDDDDSPFYAPGYGEAPPAQGAMVVEAPPTLDGAAERTGLLHSVNIINDSYEPRDTREVYRVMSGLLRTGEPMTVGGNGDEGTVPTRFLFPGRPGAFWSEGCPQPGCAGFPHPPSDRRFVLSTGPFRLEPGQEEAVTLALVWARGADHLDSVEELKRAARYVRTAYDLGVFNPTPLEPEPPPPLPGGIEVERPAPNPFADRSVLRYGLPGAARVRLVVHDALGREVAVLADGPREAGPHEATLDGAALVPGVYFARFIVNGQRAAVLPLTRR